MSRCAPFVTFRTEEENQAPQDDLHVEMDPLSWAEAEQAAFSSLSEVEKATSRPASVPLENTLEEAAAAGIVSVPSDPTCCPLRACHFLETMADILELYPQIYNISSRANKGAESEEEAAGAEATLLEALSVKMYSLAEFLLHKYRTMQLTTREVMLRILDNDVDNFDFILSQVSECMQLVFGIDVMEVDTQAHRYALVTTLGLTYSGMVGPQQIMPTTGLLVTVLGVILLEGGCASEEVVWEQLSFIGVYPGRKHFIYGEPMELLTNVWVWEQYLQYKLVPGSNPTYYQFLWGPRAHIEISKVEFMEFLFTVIRIPSCS